MSNNFIRYQPQKLTLQDIFDELTLLHPIGPDDPWNEDVKKDFEMILMRNHYNNALAFNVKSIPFHGIFHFDYNLRRVGITFEEHICKSKNLEWSHIETVLKFCMGDDAAAQVPPFDTQNDDPYTFIKNHIFPLLKNPNTNKKYGFRKKAKMIYQILGEYKRQFLPVEERYLDQTQMQNLRERITSMVLERDAKDTLESIPLEQIYNRILPSLSFVEQLYAQNFISHLTSQFGNKQKTIKGLDKLYFCHPKELTFASLKEEIVLPTVVLTEEQLKNYAHLYAYLMQHLNEKENQHTGAFARYGARQSADAINARTIEVFFGEHLFGGCMSEDLFNKVIHYYHSHQIEIDANISTEYPLLSNLFDPVIAGSRLTDSHGRAKAQHLTTIMHMVQRKGQTLEIVNEVDLFMN